MGNIDTDFGNGIDISHWWGISIPFWETVSFFPTGSTWWGIPIPILETVSFLPTSGELKYRFSKGYQYSPLVGKKDTDLGNGILFPHSSECPPILGNDPTTPYPLWANSIPFFGTVFNLPTSGQIRYRSEKRYWICPRAYHSLPSVGKFDIVFSNGIQFAHWWANSIPFWKTVLNLPTSLPRLTLGGQIRYRFWERYSICPLVGKLKPVSENGTQFAHCHGLLYLIRISPPWIPLVGKFLPVFRNGQ